MWSTPILSLLLISLVIAILQGTHWYPLIRSIVVLRACRIPESITISLFRLPNFRRPLLSGSIGIEALIVGGVYAERMMPTEMPHRHPAYDPMHSNLYGKRATSHHHHCTAYQFLHESLRSSWYTIQIRVRYAPGDTRMSGKLCIGELHQKVQAPDFMRLATFSSQSEYDWNLDTQLRLSSRMGGTGANVSILQYHHSNFYERKEHEDSKSAENSLCFCTAICTYIV
jgi:hypothetical protein